MAHLRIFLTFDTELYRTLSLPVSGGNERENIREVRGAAAEGMARIAHEEGEQYRPYRDEELRLDAFHEEVINEELRKRPYPVACLKRIQQDLPDRDVGEYADGNTHHEHRFHREERGNAFPEPHAIDAPHDAALEIGVGESARVGHGHKITR